MNGSGNWGPFKPAAVVLLLLGAAVWLAGALVDGSLRRWVQPTAKGTIVSAGAEADFPPGAELVKGRVRVRYEYSVVGLKMIGEDDFPWPLSRDPAANRARLSGPRAFRFPGAAARRPAHRPRTMRTIA